MALSYGSMRYNGLLNYQNELSDSEELNEYGEIATVQSPSWSDDIPCSIKTNTDTRKGHYEDGEFRQASYTILIEFAEFNAKRVKLSRLGEELGEFRVLSVEPLSTVGRVQILV